MRSFYRMSPFFFLLIILAACNSSEQNIPTERVETMDEYGNMEVYFRRKSNYAKEGLYLRMVPNGHIIEEANFSNDTLHGLRVLYYEQGDTQIVEQYHRGDFLGPFRSYYASGKLEQEGQYIDNEMAGDWKRYYESGQLMEMVRFVHNQENGPFVEYYENGKLKAEGQYLDGDKEHGELKLYNENGELVRIMDCDQGICRTRWKAAEEGS